jgi:hypothetical protein
LTLRSPKSEKDREVVFIPQKVAHCLKEYISAKAFGSDRTIFPISYKVTSRVLNKEGKVVGFHLQPHDLRRHAATDASRSAVPIETVSKVILKLANPSTTQLTEKRRIYAPRKLPWAGGTDPEIRRGFPQQFGSTLNQWVFKYCKNKNDHRNILF